MEKRGSTERVKRLREESMTAEPHISIERAILMTETYKEHQGSVSTPVLRAIAFKNIMENKKLCINDGELIVGEKGEGPQSTPTFPELCCHTMEDLEVMSSRERIFFKVSDETKRIQEETIIPFWEKRSIRHKIINSMTQAWRDCYENGLYTEFMEQRSPGHTVADGKMYRNGFLDFKARIESEIAKIDFLNDLEATSKHEQLKAMSICCDAIIAYGTRYAAYARELAAVEQDPKRKEELLLIASNCDVVPAHKPETFMQAVQMYWFAHIGVTCELNNWDAYSPGRLDQHLYPFYKKEAAEGSLSKERAQEILECLWVKFNNQPSPPKVGITLKESGTYTDFANINTGGITEGGQNGVNDVSYLILDTMDEMKLLQPSSNVQISQKTPDAFVKRACEISRKGWGQPAFYNTEAVIQELMNAGKSIEDARQGGTSGCVETGAYGKEAYILTGYFNLPKILEITLHNGLDPVSGKQ
ncbi:MAG: pyruvate formate lyase family protein, partial [Clostridia bacterium]|nr:pyruvate formate lyase family protein [Clostridia bacterium]